DGLRVVLSGEYTSSVGKNPARHPLLRRWDYKADANIQLSSKDNAIPIQEGKFLDLEDGIQVQFQPGGGYRTGDYWMIPARTETEDIEWPRRGSHALLQPPKGIEHHYCGLAIFDFSEGTISNIRDCRKIFPPLTELTRFFYVGGDGQEAMPENQLPEPIQVGVANGRWPVANVPVKFELLEGGGTLNGGTVTTANTGSDGIAQCTWKLGRFGSQRIKATLRDASDNPISQPIFFNAGLSIAADVSYDSGRCEALTDARTVQDAIDKLCQMPRGSGCSVTVGIGGSYERLDEAIIDLMDKGQKEICICLLPGEHHLPDGLNIKASESLHLHIMGCNTGTRLILKGEIFAASLDSIALTGLNVVALDVAKPIFFKNCGEVVLRSCRLVNIADGGALVTINSSRRIVLENNVIEAYERERRDIHEEIMQKSEMASGLFKVEDRLSFIQQAEQVAGKIASLELEDRITISRKLEDVISQIRVTEEEAASYKRLGAALRIEGRVDPNTLFELLLDIFDAAAFSSPHTALILEDGNGDATIVDNRITGVVSLYGDQLPDANIEWENGLERLAARLKERPAQFINVRNSLWLRGNSLTTMRLGSDIIKQILESANPIEFKGIFRLIFLTDNFIQLGQNHLLAQEVRLTSNRFDHTSKQSIGSAVSFISIYTGNTSSPLSEDHAVPPVLKSISHISVDMGSNPGINIDKSPW
ncbi:MAG TPA: DUF6519 domain-containing protein, partial [Methanotrichaceae archaeon]|nr:DUF6519 domain-containing protein [Methanotrichaceae archaeon]